MRHLVHLAEEPRPQQLALQFTTTHNKQCVGITKLAALRHCWSKWSSIYYKRREQVVQPTTPTTLKSRAPLSTRCLSGLRGSYSEPGNFFDEIFLLLKERSISYSTSSSLAAITEVYLQEVNSSEHLGLRVGVGAEGSRAAQVAQHARLLLAVHAARPHILLISILILYTTFHVENIQILQQLSDCATIGKQQISF